MAYHTMAPLTFYHIVFRCIFCNRQIMMRSDIKLPQPFAVGVIHYNSHAIFDRLEFFTPGCKLYELSIGHVFRWPMLQQKFQISVNVQAVRLCHLNHCIDYSTGIGSFYRITEQPVFPTDCKRTDRVLGSLRMKYPLMIYSYQTLQYQT